MPKYSEAQIKSLQRAWWVAGRTFDVTCNLCGCAVTDMADKCRAPLDCACPGFAVLEDAGREFDDNIARMLARENSTERAPHMHALRLKETKSVPVKYIRARCGVRYWEDATVNGEEDTDGSRIPLREGTAADNDHLGGGNWCPTIDLDTGIIENWPKGTTASVHYKCCDDGDYELLDADRNVVTAIDGYVPPIMCPEGEGYGDYVIMEIDGDGKIANWRADLSKFETEDE